MARFHATVNGPVPFTPEEEAEWDALAHDWENVVFPERVREDRNVKLKESDWTQAADVPQAIKDKWAPYRQALRDIPQQAGFPDNITWPTKPE